MTQRIFDVENAEDMQDLWEILPDSINNIHKYGNNGLWDDVAKQGYLIINIKWHNKSTLSRPVKEATEADVGKLCYFGDKTLSKQFVGLLGYVADVKAEDGYKRYQMLGGYWWNHARRLTKQEIEELI